MDMFVHIRGHLCLLRNRVCEAFRVGFCDHAPCALKIQKGCQIIVLRTEEGQDGELREAVA